MARDADPRNEQEQLLAQRQLLQDIIENSGDPIYVKDLEGRYLLMNSAEARAFDRPLAELLGRTDEELYPAEAAGMRAAEKWVIETRQPLTVETVFHAASKEPRRYLLTKYPRFDADGEVIGTIGHARDITVEKVREAERRLLEERMLHAQKLESLGLLAGGIAHDFNNILMGVIGNVGLAQLELPADSPVRPFLEDIELAGRRASDLANQLLAYSGKASLELAEVELGAIVAEMARLLGSTITKSTYVELERAPGLPPIRGDAAQLRQVVMNLIINASEALGGQAGTIRVGTSLVRASRAELQKGAAGEALPPGQYVQLRVEDDGCGMDARTLRKVFDPFFTTKRLGRGLGMAAVLGIVRAHSGTVLVESEPGRGTCFRVLFPPGAVPASRSSSAERSRGDRTISGTVLVVDDEATVLNVARLILERAGARVLTASDGQSALAILSEYPEPVDLVLLDLTMPGMSGQETLGRLRATDASLPVLLSSGYHESELLGDGATGFVPKPYTPAQLIDAIAAALAGP